MIRPAPSVAEGRLVMSPSPVPDHNYASGEFRQQVSAQVPRRFEVNQDVDVDLRLAAPHQPGSAVIKRVEYADAGIPHSWIVDLDEPVSLTTCHLAGSPGYQDSGATTGVFSTTEPFPVRVDLDALL